MTTAFSPTDIVSSAASHPAISLPTPAFTTLNAEGSQFSECVVRHRTR